MLTEQQRRRYQRHVVLSGLGPAGQARLLNSAVLVVGTGGLGSPVAFYLAAAGVGRITLADPDVVDLSNLQRQILHSTADLGRRKVDSAAQKLHALNSEIHISTCPEGLTVQNAAQLVENHDLVVDCLDNFPTRYLLNRICRRLGRPLIYGGVLAYSGQLMTILPGRGPCLACLYRDEPPEGAPDCARYGILAPVPGVIGTLQAVEAIKYLTGNGDLLVGRLLIYDALPGSFMEVKIQPDPECPVCGRIKP
ncbi:MAG: HesA/MoeB/ThiF family protein [Desulfurispora sp.]|uniref:HesA/MoeB/ThiF family protein n=1 Tax=Desulfurispora sp. TaxID=3014275 RepID=UPI00404A7BA5